MKVKLTESRMSINGQLNKGTVIEVSEHEAARMFAAGQCVALDDKPIPHTELTLQEIADAEAAKKKPGAPRDAFEGDDEGETFDEAEEAGGAPADKAKPAGGGKKASAKK